MWMLLEVALVLLAVYSAQNDEKPPGEIAFTRYDGVKNRIYIMNADGTNARPLTGDRYNVFSPIWSPDGQKIAYLENATDDPFNAPQTMRLMVMNADGTHPVEIAARPEKGFIVNPAAYFSWSPDSQRITYMMYTGYDDAPIQLYVASVDGREPVKLGEATNIQGFARFISANELLHNSFNGLERINVNSDERILVGTLESQPFALSPDAAQLAILASDVLQVMNIDLSGAQSIYQNIPGRNRDETINYGYNMAWSPDARYIAGAVRMNGLPQPLPLTMHPYAIFVARVDGSEFTLIQSDNEIPTWSPDSAYIAYSVQDANGLSQIAIARVDGSDEVILTSGDINAFPAWRPIIE